MSVPRDDEILRAGHRWWRYARDDLRLAERALDVEEPIPHSACFASQQATEKAIKAILVFLQIDYPRTHDLERLRRLLPPGGRVRDAELDPQWLSDWAIEGRYPTDLPEASEEDADTALSLAREVLALAQADLERIGVLPSGTTER